MNASAKTNEWTNKDNQAAIAQGWFLADIWDSGRRRMEYEISAVTGAHISFKTDESARAFVLTRVQAGDKLAEKAARCVFISKVKGAPKGKKK